MCKEEGRSRPGCSGEGAASSCSGSRRDTGRHGRGSRCGQPGGRRRRPRATRPQRKGRDAPGSSRESPVLRWRGAPARPPPRAARQTSSKSGERCSSPPTTASTAGSCGSRTAPRRARSWSRTSDPDQYTATTARLPDPPDLTAVGGTLFFTADDGVHGRELWKSDGTKAGTVLVKDITPRRRCQRLRPVPLTDVGGTLFFTADDGVHGEELWKSDGTKAGTVLVKDISPTQRPRLQPVLADRCGRDVVLHRRRRRPRPGAVEVGRHQGGHRPGQGHPARYRLQLSPYLPDRCGRDVVLHRRRRRPRPGAVEVGRHQGRHRPGQGHHSSASDYSGSALPDRCGRDVVLRRRRRHPRRELWKSDGTKAGTVLVKDITPARLRQLSRPP